jgi:hypothetical protein
MAFAEQYRNKYYGTRNAGFAKAVKESGSDIYQIDSAGNLVKSDAPDTQEVSGVLSDMFRSQDLTPEDRKSLYSIGAIPKEQTGLYGSLGEKLYDFNTGQQKNVQQLLSEGLIDANGQIVGGTGTISNTSNQSSPGTSEQQPTGWVDPATGKPTAQGVGEPASEYQKRMGGSNLSSGVSNPPSGAIYISDPNQLKGLTEAQIWRDPNSQRIYKLANGTPDPTTTPTQQGGQKATLYGANGQKEVVDVGSQRASDLQSQGWGLTEGSYKAPAGTSAGSGAGSTGAGDVQGAGTPEGSMGTYQDFYTKQAEENKKYFDDMLTKLTEQQNTFLDTYKNQPSLVDELKRLREEQGLPALEKEVANIDKTILDTEGLIDNLEKDITARTQGFPVSESARRRMLAMEGKPLTEQLNQLIRGRARLATGLSSKEQVVQQLLEAEQAERNQDLETAKMQYGFNSEKLGTLTDLFQSSQASSEKGFLADMEVKEAENDQQRELALKGYTYINDPAKLKGFTESDIFRDTDGRIYLKPEAEKETQLIVDNGINKLINKNNGEIIKTYGSGYKASTTTKKDEIDWGTINSDTGKTPEQTFLDMGISQEIIDMAKTSGLKPKDLM